MDDVGRQIEAEVPRLRRYALALAGDPTRAEDLLQDSLERAWARLHLWRRGSNLRAWLFTIMHNLHANSARRFTTGPVVYSLPAESPALGVGATQDAVLEVKQIREALEKLPEEQRQVLLLVGMEQLRYQEVADILGIPIGTVMSRLHRGREALRARLAGRWGEGGTP